MLLFLTLPFVVSLWRRPDQRLQNSASAALLVPMCFLVGALVMASLIGLARVYVGLHYPVDIFGGAIDGLMAALVVTALCTWFSQPTKAVLGFAQTLRVA